VGFKPKTQPFATLGFSFVAPLREKLFSRKGAKLKKDRRRKGLSQFVACVTASPFDFACTFNAIFIGRGSVLMKCDCFGGERNGCAAHLKMEFKK
jgi:hypothetical protein